MPSSTSMALILTGLAVVIVAAVVALVMLDTRAQWDAQWEALLTGKVPGR